jgi:histidinol-phosphate/aromatic aminotransferase/cobyric acid decarboxylase-like protein
VLADPDIITVLARVITPYSLPTPTIESVLTFTNAAHRLEAEQRIETILTERERLTRELGRSPLITRVWRSDANFILVDCMNPEQVLHAANEVGLILRDTRSQPGLAHSVRISVGSPEQNDRLLSALRRAAGAAA